MSSSLLIRIYSFSYRKGGPPRDVAGNGGGHVFDCRCLPNPHWQEELREQTGMDQAVQEMLDGEQSAARFVRAASEIVFTSARNYDAKGYEDLYAAFGCTGGRHRSVYCAERVAAMLRVEGYDVQVRHWRLELERPEDVPLRGMVLAAGLGTRLKPLTETTPKALVEAGGKPMLAWAVETLERAGVSQVVVNTHHHADQIERWARTRREEAGETEIILSHENEILGTGGGIRRAGRWLHGPAPVILQNADIWHDYDLAALRDEHRAGDVATLLVQERESSSYLLVDGENRVIGLEVMGKHRLVAPARKGSRALAFSGVHIASPALFELLALGDEFSIIEAYLRIISEGHTVRARLVEGAWFDMGTPEKLAALEKYVSTLL